MAAVRSRGGLASQFAVIAGMPSVNGLKSYLTPTLGKNLMVWDSLGNLWAENPQGTLNLINSRPYQNLFYEAVTLFGRDYEAYFNNLGGFDIPRQYDATNWDRVSQVGPGDAPSFVEEVASVALPASPGGLSNSGAMNTVASPNGLMQQGNVTTVSVVNLFSTVRVGDSVIIAGAGVGGYNGTWTIAAVDYNANQFQFVSNVTGLAASGNGTVTSSMTIVAVSPGLLGLTTGTNPLVTIAGAGIAGYNGTWPVRAIQGGVNFIVAVTTAGLAASGNGTVSISGNIAAGLHQGTVAFITRQGLITMPAVPPSSFTATGNRRVLISNIATGPPNIVARLLMFTPVITPPATTGSFYSLPNGTTQLQTSVMLINDNTSTSFAVDFTDAILISGFSANYLFTQLELGEVACSLGYNSRLLHLGERNRQANLVNMSFDGGFGSLITGTTVSSSGPNSPTASGNGGAGFQPWVNPHNVFAADGVLATCVIGSGVSSKELFVTGFGFAIPSNATISGISVAVLCKATATDLSDQRVFLLKNSLQVGSNHANGNGWTAGLTNQNYGSTSDLWGTTWTPADVNAAGFGVSVEAFNNSLASSRTASIDYVSITISYSVPGTVGVGLSPRGWTRDLTSFAGGNSAIAGSFPVDYGDAYAITGDGATAVRGKITQSFYRDWLGTPICGRNIEYRVRVRLALSGVLTQGTLHINLKSANGAFTTAGLSVSCLQLTTSYAEFDALLTSAIVAPPTDLVIQLYVDGTPDNNGTFLIDSVEPYPTNVPFNYSSAKLSHAFNPESYDGTTGQIQVRPGDGQALRSGFSQRNNLYLAKDHYLGYVTDDGVNEPASWAFNEVSSTIGICGPNAADSTEEWSCFAERSGVYLCWGADPVKISQEIETDAALLGRPAWDLINWNAAHTIWVRIDSAKKRILVGVPINGAITPNIVFGLDYKWLTDAQDIASSPSVTYSAFTGKILTHGRSRRWFYWNITANSMCLAERADGTAQPFFGNGVGNGKIYQQLAANLQPSDDGAVIAFLWRGYASPSSEEEQALQLGTGRKLAGYLKFQAQGAGALQLAVITAARTTALRNYPLALSPAGDGERPLNIQSERFVIQAGTNAVNDWAELQKLTIAMKKAPSTPVRGLNA